MMHRLAWSALFGASAAFLAFGCSSADSGADSSDAGASDLAGAGPVFEDSFTNYKTWKSFQYSESADAGPHAAGPRTEWINHVPPHGSTEFPLGTIIVKNISSIGQTFAMEKRGEDYNSGGADGWEFFELNPPAADGTITFIWRGAGPPLGEVYGGDPTACNSCHAGFKSNDYIPSPPLQLGNF